MLRAIPQIRDNLIHISKRIVNGMIKGARTNQLAKMPKLLAGGQLCANPTADRAELVHCLQKEINRVSRLLEGGQEVAPVCKQTAHDVALCDMWRTRDRPGPE